ncbi:sulfite exporter TauE/SafE family protein [Agromyces sp. H3Y2-19a]|uniref:sulfite exporter TauE/SafE family protein n=1 Tax=Agromyces TaxID=33877 RepID=UPI001E5E6AF6|nr:MULTISPECIES: sulfite exporter TauE/SafE family protein [Agromyces]MCD5345752.1 sulfite exporter TauE/SafE family protein [Agromyces sp. S2-1-8]MDF0512118.1 sulfite exporter TauE/SafE family protein [Agromyces chromiiresistens]
MLLPVALSVLVGAASQRITGMGFALIAAPALVVLLGPFDGVVVVNLCAVLSSLLILPRVWRLVEGRRLAWLLPPAILGTVAGAIVAANVPGPVLQVGVGLLVVVALTVTLVVTRTAAAPSDDAATGPAPAIIAGAASGFMNASAGVGGPALSVYAVATRWPQAGFAATAQAYFIVIGSAALLGKFVATGWSWPSLDPAAWPFVIGALLVGLLIGEWLAPRVSHRAARLAVVVIAYVGGAAALVDGVLELLG